MSDYNDARDEGDYKELYSEASKYYVENNEADFSFQKSKAREARYGEDWAKHKVNINEVIDYFAPDADAYKNKQKMIFEGADYTVIADMVSGYLRIYSKQLKAYVTLDGSLGTEKETHYKIKRREEM